MFQFIKQINNPVKAAPLAVFRICFGLLMLISIIRFWSKGWIYKLYIEPDFHFSYWGFEWVKPLGNATYLIFIICGIASIFVAIGFKYRLAIIVFFLSFTYIELMDKTTYLNHYYFISCLSFLLIFLPLGKHYSLDSKWKLGYTPKFNILSIQVLLAIIYFYAGLAKLNSEWLIDAKPLSIWLSTKTDLPLIGPIMDKEWAHYAFSWFGALYDLTIPFLLWIRKTRIFAFIVVVIFHIMTRILFPIGMFPFIMIICTLIFFSENFHEKIIQTINKIFKRRPLTILPSRTVVMNQFNIGVVSVFFLIQLVLPWRYVTYPDELFWTEEGYRFSWRVMLMEKAGYAQFKIVNGENGNSFLINNNEFLTPVQQKQMAQQPDFIF